MNKNWSLALPSEARTENIDFFRGWGEEGFFWQRKHLLKWKDGSQGVDNLFPNGSASSRFQLVPCRPLQETPSRHLGTAPTWASGNLNPLWSPLYRNPASLEWSKTEMATRWTCCRISPNWTSTTTHCTTTVAPYRWASGLVKGQGVRKKALLRDYYLLGLTSCISMTFK